MTTSLTTNPLHEKYLRLMSELEEVAENASHPRELLEQMLPRLISEFQAQSGVIWMTDGQGNLRLVLQENWVNSGVANNETNQQQHRQLISKAANSHQVLIISQEDQPTEPLPAPFTFAFVPLKQQQKLQGIIELVLPPVISLEMRSSIIQLLEHCAGLVGSFREREQDPFVPLNAPGFWDRLEPGLIHLYRLLDSRKLAYQAAQEFVHYLSVDRVTIMGKYGRKTKLLAVSGQSHVPFYSPVIKQLHKLCRLVNKSEQIMIHTGKKPVMNPTLMGPISDYLEQSGTQTLVIFPLWSQPDEDPLPNEPNRKRDVSRHIVGTMIIERSRSSQFDAEREKVARLLADHLGNALDKAYQYETIFLLPVWRAIGNSFRWLYRHKFWQSLATLVGIGLIVAALIFVDWDYRVTGEGRLMPVIQRQAFVPWDAEVEAVFVHGGETVKAGDPLIQLTNKELETEEVRVRTLINEKETSIRALRSARENILKGNKKSEALEIEGHLAEHIVEVEHLKLQYKIIEERIANLLVKSPIDGIVVTFQVDQLLQHRPVNRGDVLLEVMDPSKDWQLELKVEDKRMGHLIQQQEKTKAELPVEYILATDPETSFYGELKKVATRTNVDPEKGNLVEVQVALTNEANLPRRIGAAVKAKINCGPKPLGYVLFGDVIDYVRKILWL